MRADEFQTISRFSRVGDAHAVERPRLRSWDEWGGPEDPRVEAIHLRQQQLHDQIVGDDPAAERFFLRVRDEVIHAAAGQLPGYDPSSDAWDPRSLAVWHAGWTAALVACFETRALDLPRELDEQWHWFREGHWPAAFVSDPPEKEEYKCIVL
jgi:hypothetical protein